MVRHLPRAGQRSSRSQRAEVGRELAVGPATTVVPRPSTVSPVSSAPSAGSSEGQRVGGVPGRGDDAQLEPGHRRPRRRRRGRRSAAAERAHRGAGQLREPGRRSAWSGWPWVSSMRATRSPRAATCVERRRRGAARRSGPGSTTTHRCDPGSASTQVLVPSSVIGPGFGASTQVARAVTAPPDQPLPRHRAHAAAAGSPRPVGPSAAHRAARTDATSAAPGPAPARPAAPGPARRRTPAALAARGHLLHAHDGRRQHQRAPGRRVPQQRRPGRSSRRGRPRWSGRRPPGPRAAARRRTGCRSGGARTPG